MRPLPLWESEVFGMKLDLKNSIPIEVLESEYYGCKLADQCDMGSRYDREKASAIKIVLEWFKTPSYQDRLYSCGIKEIQESEESGNE